MDKITSKSKLTQKDVDEISRRIKMDTFDELKKR